jgi:uncharacterized protein YoaH (UPF0181 family)
MSMYPLIEEAQIMRFAELMAQGLTEDDAIEIMIEERDRKYGDQSPNLSQGDTP